MKHKLIMENWKRFLNEARWGFPRYMDNEGVKFTLMANYNKETKKVDPNKGGTRTSCSPGQNSCRLEYLDPEQFKAVLANLHDGLKEGTIVCVDNCPE
jgi:hypothetical protein